MFRNISNRYNTVLNEELREQGFPAPEPPINQFVGPNNGTYPVPQYLTFSGLVNQVTRTFRYTTDEALRESPSNARAMRRDPVLMDALRSRQIPTCQLSHHLEPQDDTDPQQLYASANVTQIIKEIPHFQWMKMQLLEATWYGRYGNQMLIRPDYSRKFKRWVVSDHRPMNGDKIMFKWSGDAGVLVHPMFDGDIQVTDRGLCHFFTPVERQTVIIHHFEPEDVDFFDYEMAGAVQGVGVRSRLYYFWYLKSRMLQYLLDYMQRTALGIGVFYFEAGNPESFAEMSAAAQNQVGSLRLLLPRNKDGTGPGYDHFEPSNNGARLFIEFFTNYFDMIMRQFILGQSLTTQAGSTGLGSGVAEAHEATREMLMSYDATALGETLSEDLVKVLYRWNHPGVPPAKFIFDIEKPNVSEYVAAAQGLYEMGISVDADDLRSVAGLPKPEPGHEIASKLLANQATTVGTPQGTPVQSQAGQQPSQYARSPRQYSRGAYPIFQQNGKQMQYAPEAHNDEFEDENGVNRGGIHQRFSENFDGVLASPVVPQLRRSKVHKAMDEFLNLQHNRGGRRSWAQVS